MLANVKIEQDKENKHVHRVFIDGNQIEKITYLDFQVNPLEIPQVALNLEVMTGVDFEGQAEVNFLKAPFSVENACKILRDELLKHGGLYNEFLSNIESVLKEEKVMVIMSQTRNEIAEKILNRIIGEE